MCVTPYLPNHIFKLPLEKAHLKPVESDTWKNEQIPLWNCAMLHKVIWQSDLNVYNTK